MSPRAPSPATAANYFDTDWIRSSSDSRDQAVGDFTENKDQELSYRYDRRGVQTDWFTGGYDDAEQGARQIHRVINPSGTLYQKRGQLYSSRDDKPGPPESSRRTYSYFYNPNRSLTEIKDQVPSFADLPGATPTERTTLISRDPAERERKVAEDWRGGRDSILAYDPSSNVLTRRVDGQLGDPDDPDGLYSGGRSTTFTYDALNRERTMKVGERFSKTTWWPSDELQMRTKLNGTEEGSTGEPLASNPGTTERRYYLRSGEIARKVREPESGPTTTQTYDYDLDSNRLFDERGAHTYNARSQLVQWDKPTATDDQDPPPTEPGEDPVPAYDWGYATALSDPGPNQRNYATDPADYPEGGRVDYTLDGTGQSIETIEHSSFESELRQGDVVLDEKANTTVDTTATSTYTNGDLRSVLAETKAVTTDIPDQPDTTDQSKTKAIYENYDDLGNVGQIRTEDLDSNDDPTRAEPDDATPTAPGCPQTTIERWSDPETTYHCFDEFGRLAVSQGSDPDMKEGPDKEIGTADDDQRQSQAAEAWLYDGLDRRDARLVIVEGTAKLRERSYLGTTELLSRELDTDSTGPGERTEKLVKSYDYDSQGMRTGQQLEPKGENPEDPTYSTYDHDAAGSVIGLEDEQGTFDDPDSPGEDSDNRYDFDPYGSLKDPEPGNSVSDVEAELPQAAAENPFRYEGFYYDSGINSYDMQAREYRPEVGRFLSQDRFEAAGADLALQSDPLTQNRYAFAGGNPVSNIEWDGHFIGYNDQSTADGKTTQGHRAIQRGERSPPTGTGAGAAPAESSAPTSGESSQSGGTPAAPAQSTGSGPAPAPDVKVARKQALVDQLFQHEAGPYQLTHKPSVKDVSLEQLQENLRIAEERCEGCYNTAGDEGYLDLLSFIAGPFGRGGRTGAQICVRVCDDIARGGGAVVNKARDFIGGLKSKLGGGSRGAEEAGESAARSVYDLARFTTNRQQRLVRLANAGTPVGKVRNLDVPDAAAAANGVTRSLTQGPGVAVTRPRPGVAVHALPEGGQVVLRSPTSSRSKLWAVDVNNVPGAPTIRTHFRSSP